MTQAKSCRDRCGRALTLLELVLVLALLVVLAALSYPSLEGLQAEMRVSQAADQVRARWADARARAINEGQPYRFAILPDQGNLRLAPDSANYWSGGSAPPQQALAEGQQRPLVVDETLPDGVRFHLGDNAPLRDSREGGPSAQPPGSVDPGGWRTLATFLPDGTAREDAKVWVRGPYAQPIQLRLRALTGTARTEQLTPDTPR